MSKAVLIMDMPSSCDMCCLIEMINGKMYCGVKGCGQCAEDYIVCRPDWCPLRELHVFGWDGQRVSNLLCLGDVKDILEQLAEEYKHCIKSSCSNCEVYDKEKHYCPKWCDLIKGTVAEIEENHDNDFCEWQEISIGGITAVREPHRKKLFNHDQEQQFCPYCGKKFKKIAPYQPKGEYLWQKKIEITWDQDRKHLNL